MAKATKTYYKIKTLNDPKTHANSKQVTKFTSDLEVESSYAMNFIESKGEGGGYYDCQCPAAKYDCRHKMILKAFEAHRQVDGEKFYCFETKTFHDMSEVGK